MVDKTTNTALHKDSSQLKLILIVFAVMLSIISFFANDKLSIIVDTGNDNKKTISDVKEAQILFKSGLETLTEDVNDYKNETNSKISSTEQRLQSQIDNNKNSFNIFSSRRDLLTQSDLDALSSKILFNMEKKEFEYDKRYTHKRK